MGHFANLTDLSAFIDPHHGNGRPARDSKPRGLGLPHRKRGHQASYTTSSSTVAASAAAAAGHAHVVQTGTLLGDRRGFVATARALSKPHNNSLVSNRKHTAPQQQQQQQQQQQGGNAPSGSGRQATRFLKSGSSAAKLRRTPAAATAAAASASQQQPQPSHTTAVLRAAAENRVAFTIEEDAPRGRWGACVGQHTTPTPGGSHGSSLSSITQLHNAASGGGRRCSSSLAEGYPPSRERTPTPAFNLRIDATTPTPDAAGGAAFVLGDIDVDDDDEPCPISSSACAGRCSSAAAGAAVKGAPLSRPLSTLDTPEQKVAAAAASAVPHDAAAAGSAAAATPEPEWGAVRREMRADGAAADAGGLRVVPPAPPMLQPPPPPPPAPEQCAAAAAAVRRETAARFHVARARERGLVKLRELLERRILGTRFNACLVHRHLRAREAAARRAVAEARGRELLEARCACGRGAAQAEQAELFALLRVAHADLAARARAELRATCALPADTHSRVTSAEAAARATLVRQQTRSFSTAMRQASIALRWDLLGALYTRCLATYRDAALAAAETRGRDLLRQQRAAVAKSTVVLLKSRQTAERRAIAAVQRQADKLFGAVRGEVTERLAAGREEAAAFAAVAVDFREARPDMLYHRAALRERVYRSSIVDEESIAFTLIGNQWHGIYLSLRDEEDARRRDELISEKRRHCEERHRQMVSTNATSRPSSPFVMLAFDSGGGGGGGGGGGADGHPARPASADITAGSIVESDDGRQWWLPHRGGAQTPRLGEGGSGGAPRGGSPPDGDEAAAGVRAGGGGEDADHAGTWFTRDFPRYRSSSRCDDEGGAEPAAAAAGAAARRRQAGLRPKRPSSATAAPRARRMSAV